MRYFLGFDIGGTKTHALVCDETGRPLGLGEAGPGNHEVVGYPGLTAAMKKAMRAALRQARVDKRQIAGAGFGIGGYDWPSERQATLNAIAGLGLGCPVEAANDAVIGLLAGAPHGWGVALIAGTGSNCYGRGPDGRIGRLTGMGWWFGEGGGAGDMVQDAVRQILREWGRRGPPTALTPAFLKLTGARDLDEFVENSTLDRYRDRASAARLVFRVAGRGDPVACAVLESAGRELADMAIGVIRQLDLEDKSFDLVLVGSLFKGGRLLLDPLCASVRASAPQVRFRRLTVPPVTGAVILGMEQVGLKDSRLHRNLRRVRKLM